MNRKVRRLLIGCSVSLATLLGLGLLLEIGVRALVPSTFFSQYEPFWQPDDKVGFTMRPHFDGVAFGAPVRTNSLGMRGREWAKTKPEDTFRIVLLGDSHAFGYGVPFADTLGPRLEHHLAAQGTNAEVLTFALPGYNCWQQHEALVHYAQAYAPDLVIVHLTMNDHDPAAWCSDDGWLHRRSAAEPATRAQVTAQPPVAARSGPGLRAHSRLYLWAKIQWTRFQIGRRTDPKRWPKGHWMTPPHPGPVPEYLRGSVLEPLRGIARHCAERKVPMVLAAMVVGDDYRRTVDQLVKETDVPVSLLFGLFPEINNWEHMVREYGLGWDDHLDARAHDRWAQGLVALLAKRALIPD